MAIHIREAKSKEIQKNIWTVRQMTKRMGFDENMEKVNWSFVRAIAKHCSMLDGGVKLCL